jgi:hypothetical protein
LAQKAHLCFLLSIALLADCAPIPAFSVFSAVHIIAYFRFGLVRYALLLALQASIAFACFHGLNFYESWVNKTCVAVSLLNARYDLREYAP